MSSTPESVSATRRLQKALTKQKKITLAIRYVKWDYTLSHVRLHEIDDVLRTHKAFVTHGWTAQQMAGWESKLSELSEDRQEWASCLLSAREEWNGYMKHFHRLENSVS